MPGQNRTGPLGQGPLTGRCLGFCGREFEFKQGFGRNFNWRTGNELKLTKEQEKKILEAELEEVNSEKQEIEKKLKELK